MDLMVPYSTQFRHAPDADALHDLHQGSLSLTNEEIQGRGVGGDILGSSLMM
jgi:hypothetical protein